MPSVQQWVYTDVVSGETAISEDSATPPRWALVGNDHHGPLGLYIIAQRMITQVSSGNATYEEVLTARYDPESALDSGYELPPQG